MASATGPAASAAVVPHRLSRRRFLQIGALGVGGLTLPQLLRAEAASGGRSSQKSVILIYLVGGPPHQDMFDLKPDAPKEIAGPWKPIATNVTGIQICEAFPRLARIMDKLVVVRSLVGNQADHDAIQVFNGHNPRKPTPAGGWPQFGSAVAKVQGPVDPAVAAVRQPVLHLHARPVQRAGPRLPRAVVRPLPPDRPDARRHGAARHHRGSARRPQDLAPELRRPAPRRRRHRHDGRHGPLHRAGVRAAHLVAAGRGPRSVARKTRASSIATAPATRRSSWTATAPRACRRAC